jgi:hypothetical protein
MKQFWFCKPNIISMNSCHRCNNQHSYMVRPIKSSHKYMNLFENFSQCWVSYASKYAWAKGFVLRCYHRWYKCLLKLDIKRIWKQYVFNVHRPHMKLLWWMLMCKDKIFDNMSIEHIFANVFFLGVKFCNFVNFIFLMKKIVIYREFFEIKIIKLVASRPRHF